MVATLFGYLLGSGRAGAKTRNFRAWAQHHEFISTINACLFFSGTVTCSVPVRIITKSTVKNLPALNVLAELSATLDERMPSWLLPYSSPGYSARNY